MLARTDTRWAPWTVIDADDKKHARLRASAVIADALSRTVPMAAPEPDPPVLEEARRIGIVDTP